MTRAGIIYTADTLETVVLVGLMTPENKRTAPFLPFWS